MSSTAGATVALGEKNTLLTGIVNKRRDALAALECREEKQMRWGRNNRRKVSGNKKSAGHVSRIMLTLTQPLVKDGIEIRTRGSNNVQAAKQKLRDSPLRVITGGTKASLYKC